MISEERHTALAGLWVCGRPEHASADGALGHIEAKHLQLAVNTRCSSGWVLTGHAVDQTVNSSIH
jgi:hypothetical protein